MIVNGHRLSRAASAAARRGGVEGWGRVATLREHIRYAEAYRGQVRLRCCCGCGGRATHRGMANGVIILAACEPTVAAWVKRGNARIEAERKKQ